MSSTPETPESPIQPTEANTQPTQPTTPLPEGLGAPVETSPVVETPAVATVPAVETPTAPAAAPAPEAYGAPSYAPPPAGSDFAHAAPTAATAPAALAAEPTTTKSRAGVLFAGIAVGAIIGGIVGGGASALVFANHETTGVQQSSSQGTISLNNLDSATATSGVAAVATPSVVTLEVSSRSASGSGSGVIYQLDGNTAYIITNSHVVTLDGAAGTDADVKVWLSDGRILDAQVVGTDPFADLAVVKVQASGLTAIEVADSSNLNVGDLTVAIGAPLNLSSTVTSGVVSAIYRGISVGTTIIPDDDGGSSDDNGSGDDDTSSPFPWDFRFDNENGNQQSQQNSTTTAITLPVIQTDASINPGNSGGALLNANGELIGINVAIASNSGDSSSAGSDGLGFAIPSNMVVRVADALIAGERPSHGLLGVSIGDSTSDHAGGLVSEVVSGGAGEEGGLQAGDVITAVNGIAADSGTTVSALVRMNAGGSEVTISFSRNGKQMETTVTLGTLEW